MASKHQEETEAVFPVEPVQIFFKPLAHFLHVEAASGIVLICCALLALIVANSPWSDAYRAFWSMPIGIEIGSYALKHSLKHWINDGLMVIFFFVIGLEVKREMVLGELGEFSRAALPVAAAVGGMVVPAAVYLLMEQGQVAQRGWGIPMATDIAFVVGCMALLGPRIPAGLRVMLLSLAIVDDIGAILVIALGYTAAVQYQWLALGIVGTLLVLLMQRVGARSRAVYTIIGIIIWIGFHESGIHATIAGVILGLLTPARAYLSVDFAQKLNERAGRLFHGEDWERQPARVAKVIKHRWTTTETVSPLAYLIYVLHPWVAFVIMPLFALANAGVPIALSDVTSHVALAVMLGLVVGKPVGIVLFSWLAKYFGLAGMPEGVGWRHLVGGGFLAGIGFTMALFISELALQNEELRSAKVGVLMGSILSAVIGMTLLSTGKPIAETAEG